MPLFSTLAKQGVCIINSAEGLADIYYIIFTKLCLLSLFFIFTPFAFIQLECYHLLILLASPATSSSPRRNRRRRLAEQFDDKSVRFDCLYTVILTII